MFPSWRMTTIRCRAVFHRIGPSGRGCRRYVRYRDWPGGEAEHGPEKRAGARRDQSPQRGPDLRGRRSPRSETEGLIGDKYISIDPGGSESPLKPGGTIAETQAAIDIQDLIGKYAFGDVKGGGDNAPQKK